MKSCPSCQSSYPNNFAICPQDGTPLVEVGAWSEGTVIRGKYRILGKVGQGGMGAVYKALHLAFDELRALKVISTELISDDLFVKRFKQEAIITRKLQHPNAVRVDDIDEAEDGRPFIVMEFIEGRSLKKLIQDEGPLAAPRVCSIIKQVAAGLDAAHQIGMIHRDIKPDNIVLVVTPEGEQAKVLDFGVAKLKEARLGGQAGMTLTGTGVVIGTPQYMSPEQAMGKRGDDLDGRSDLYSLGIVMYQMLTGDLPFKADTTLEMLLAHMQRAPTPIRTIRPGVQIPEAIANVVMKCLEKKRELRPASARALAEELDRAEAEQVPAEALGATRVARPSQIYSAQPGPTPVEFDVGPGGYTAPPPRVPPQPRRPQQVVQQRAPVVTPPDVEPRQPSPPPPRPIPRAVSAPPPAQPKSSRWGIWVSLAILAGGLVIGGVVITSHNKSGSRESSETTSTTSSTSATSVPSASPVLTQEESKKQGAGQENPEIMQRIEEKKEKRTDDIRPPRPRFVDRQKVLAAIRLGDFFLNRGEYGNAIKAYEDGLKLDPNDADLRTKLARAKKAYEVEQKVLR